MEKRFVSVKDAATYCGISPRGMWRLLSARVLASYRLGRRTMIDLGELEKYLERQKTGARVH